MPDSQKVGIITGTSQGIGGGVGGRIPSGWLRGRRTSRSIRPQSSPTTSPCRLGEVSDVVDGIMYLERATFVTGQIVHIDGGQALDAESAARTRVTRRSTLIVDDATPTLLSCKGGAARKEWP